jgi:hypothetical protein
MRSSIRTPPFIPSWSAPEPTTQTLNVGQVWVGGLGAAYDGLRAFVLARQVNVAMKNTGLESMRKNVLVCSSSALHN